jgi:hypothetical protein
METCWPADHRNCARIKTGYSRQAASYAPCLEGHGAYLDEIPGRASGSRNHGLQRRRSWIIIHESGVQFGVRYGPEVRAATAAVGDRRPPLLVRHRYLTVVGPADTLMMA